MIIQARAVPRRELLGAAALQLIHFVQHLDDGVDSACVAVRPEIPVAVLAQEPRLQDARIRLGRRNLDVGIRFVVAQQDIVLRLVFFYECIFQVQRIFFSIYNGVSDVCYLSD